MDKAATLLCPDEIHLGFHARSRFSSILAAAPINLLRAISRTALGKTLMGIVGIEQILAALVVLHMEGTERTVQFLGSHPEFLGYLSGGETGDGVEHIVGIESLRHQSVDIPFERENLLGTLLDFHHLLPHLLVELPDALILFGDEFRLLLDGAPQDIFGFPEDAFRLLAYLLLRVALVPGYNRPSCVSGAAPRR